MQHFPAHHEYPNQETGGVPGLTLIERNSKSISLTPMGQEVLEKARRIVAEVEDLLATTRAPRGPLTGPLNLGVCPTLAPYFLPYRER